MPNRPPNYTGYGGYGPWPETDLPFDGNPGGGHYDDGYRDRFPGGTRWERPSDYWLDCLVYPDRTSPSSDEDAVRLDLGSRGLVISVGNVTGRKNGPGDE